MPIERISARGGARIGWANATWPFAKLEVDPNCLKLSLLGVSYDFAPAQVVSLERNGSIPFFSTGIRVRHSRPDYPSKIIFWYLGYRSALIEEIQGIGFLPSAPGAAEAKWRGLPLRWTAIALFILAWNGLFLLDRPGLRIANRPGIYPLLALLMVFVFCWRIRNSVPLQKLVLNDGHFVGEIKAYLVGIQVVCGLLLFIFTVLVGFNILR